MSTLQKPIQSPYKAASTSEDVMESVDLTGQLAIVTGGYSGLGLVTTKALAKAGAQVIVPARDLVRAQAALADIDGVTVQAMDLMQTDSISAFSHSVVAQGRPISLLINCAGVMASPLARDADGHESQFATNHLGHYRLVCGLGVSNGSVRHERTRKKDGRCVPSNQLICMGDAQISEQNAASSHAWCQTIL